jgi:hypothetical protein
MAPRSRAKSPITPGRHADDLRAAHRHLRPVRASDFVRSTVENLFAEGGGEGEVALAYAAPDTGMRDLGVVTDGGLSGIAENVSILPKTKLAEDAGLGRSERIVTIRERTAR